jgi:hypothetical protein
MKRCPKNGASFSKDDLFFFERGLLLNRALFLEDNLFIFKR